MRIINFSVEVTDEEFANFLARVSGADGRNVTHDVAETTTEENEPVNESAPATDKNGVAWDARYHAGSKALNADGTWRRRRGLSEAEVAEADAYEKGAPAEPAAPAAPAMPGLPTAAPAAPAMPGLPATAPQPVSYEEVVELYTQAAARNPSLDIAGIYATAGVTDPNVLTAPEGAELRIKLAELLRTA